MVLKKQSTYEQCNQAPVNTKIQLGITREADLFTLYSIPYLEHRSFDALGLTLDVDTHYSNVTEAEINNRKLVENEQFHSQ
jgi:hypothetical protein